MVVFNYQSKKGTYNMRYLLLAGAMMLSVFSTSADASERLRVHDVHKFVDGLNVAVNNLHSINGQNKLENMISNQALFEDNVNSHGYNPYLVNNTYNPNYYAYRYPYHQGYANVGYKSNNKWEKISTLQTKKRTIPGYKGVFEVSEMTISPLADSAVVDVDFKEQSLTYAPGYTPYYYQHANLNTHSKCKMHLGKMNDTVYLTRMYCNTSTNLPL